MWKFNVFYWQFKDHINFHETFISDILNEGLYSERVYYLNLINSLERIAGFSFRPTSE
jgi:hypothetical protein